MIPAFRSLFCTGQFMEWDRLSESLKFQSVGTTPGDALGAASDNWILRAAEISIQAIFISNHAGEASRNLHRVICDVGKTLCRIGNMILQWLCVSEKAHGQKGADPGDALW